MSTENTGDPYLLDLLNMLLLPLFHKFVQVDSRLKWSMQVIVDRLAHRPPRRHDMWTSKERTFVKARELRIEFEIPCKEFDV